MCIAVPMLVDDVEGLMARCSARGCRREVSLLLIADEPLKPGDHLLVHQGTALRVIDADEAALIWEALDLADAGARAGGEQLNFVNPVLPENASC